jgi:hypothetical protein
MVSLIVVVSGQEVKLDVSTEELLSAEGVYAGTVARRSLKQIRLRG